MATYIPVQIDDDRYALGIEGGLAILIAGRTHAGDMVLLWFPPAPPKGFAHDVLETAGYATTAPHGRVR